MFKILGAKNRRKTYRSILVLLFRFEEDLVLLLMPKNASDPYLPGLIVEKLVAPLFGLLFSILTRPRGSKQDFICRLQCTATKTIRPRVRAELTHIETRISWSSRGLLAKLPRMDEHLRCDLGISWKEKKVNIIRVRSG